MSSDKELKDAKWKLIAEIKAKGAFWDSMAKYDAIESARRPLDEEMRRKAINSVAKADQANSMAEEIVELVHQYWPKG